MDFDITKGNPTPDEVMAIQAVMAQLNSQETTPAIRRSVYGLPQLRVPLARQINFGTRRFT